MLIAKNVAEIPIEASALERFPYWKMLPWFPIREVCGTNMVEVNIFFFCWLGGLIEPLHAILPGESLATHLQIFILARVGLEGFELGGQLARAFPRSADAANELLAAINEFVPPVGAQMSQQSLSATVQKWQADRLKALCTALSAAVRDEAQRSYILKIEDQRSLSSPSLVEKIENCFAPDAWAIMELQTKREFEEAGKCLAFERYTSAGFHALRGVECMIRQYIKKLTGALPTKRDWWSYINVLTKNGADSKVIAVLDNIRTHERNPLMHPELFLDIDDAVGVFNIAQTAVVRLAAGIK
jgi:hypothetical protein